METTLTPEQLAVLRSDFPAEVIGKLPREACGACRNLRKNGGKPWDTCDRHKYFSGNSPCPECGGKHGSGAIHLDFVGHADVTDRLLTVDPGWFWEPVEFCDDGTPLIAARGNTSVMWIRLTVGGVTRLGVGTVESRKDDVEKELIGDALRNAAMRFGVALSLWSKADRLESQLDTTPDQPIAAVKSPARDEQQAADEALFERAPSPATARAVEQVAESMEIDDSVKAKAVPKRELMAAMPEGMDETGFIQAVIAKANTLHPASSPKHRFKTVQGVLKRPAVARQIIELLDTGQFFNSAAEPFGEDGEMSLVDEFRQEVKTAGIDPLGVTRYINDHLKADPPVPNVTAWIEQDPDRARVVLDELKAAVAEGQPWPPVSEEVPV